MSKSKTRIQVEVTGESPVTEPVQIPAPTPMQAVALDLGNAYCVLTASGGITATWRSVQGRISDAKRLKDLPFEDVLKFGETWYVFGEKAYTYAPRNLEDYPAKNRYTSPWYKRLFTYALHRAYGLRVPTDETMSPRVILSVPASLYSNEPIVQNIRRNLIGSHEIHTTFDTCLKVEIVPDDLVVIPEGAGSFIAAASVEGGGALNHGLWFVLDVGYLTTDLIVFRDGEYVPDFAMSDDAAGISEVAKTVARHVAGVTGVDLDPVDIDPQLQCESIIVNSLTVPIKEVRDMGLMALGERIGRLVLQASAGQNVTGVLLTGGGTDHVRNYIAAAGLPTITRTANPRRDNVDGAFKMLVD